MSKPKIKAARARACARVPGAVAAGLFFDPLVGAARPPFCAESTEPPGGCLIRIFKIELCEIGIYTNIGKGTFGRTAFGSDSPAACFCRVAG